MTLAITRGILARAIGPFAYKVLFSAVYCVCVCVCVYICVCVCVHVHMCVL